MFMRSIRMVLILIAGVPLVSRAAEDSKDVKEIRAAVKGFITAIGKGDAVEARRHATSDQVTSTMIDAVIPLMKASNQLDAASIKAFGAQQGPIYQNQANPLAALAPFVRAADTGQVVIKGNDAALSVMAPQTQPADADQQQDFRQPNPNNFLYLRYEADAWRVNISAMRNARQMVQMAPLLKAVAEAMNQTADQIREGLYPDFQSAQYGMQQNLRAATRRARGQ
ncbi:MAG TPA: hypothetical protein VH370_10820 [Humisphaera sp.]|jgi:hypothetical protein|nr:hypothetical protein [Humisphaera sp.]